MITTTSVAYPVSFLDTDLIGSCYCLNCRELETFTEIEIPLMNLNSFEKIPIIFEHTFYTLHEDVENVIEETEESDEEIIEAPELEEVIKDDVINDESENIVVAPSPVVQSTSSNTAANKYVGVRFTVTTSELYLLGRMIHRESHWEDYLGRLATAQTALDRLETNHAGKKTLRGVLVQSGQFCIANNRYGCSECLQTAKDALDGSFAVPNYYVLYFKQSKTEKDWHSPYIMHIGNHAFYGIPRQGIDDNFEDDILDDIELQSGE